MGLTDVLSGRPLARRTILAAFALAATVVPSAAAQAQSKLEARYAVTVAGVLIGRGVWITDIGEEQYTTVVSGRVTGILRAVTKGEGTGAARGLVNGGRLVPTSYATH